MRLYIVLVLLLVSGCRSRDRPFRTYAVYNAPLSGYRLIVFSSGEVRANEDLTGDAQGSAVLCPTSGSARALKVDFGSISSPIGHYEIAGGASGTFVWDDVRGRKELERVLVAAGYPIVAGDVTESIRVIGGAMEGPKATLVKGQTKSLDVMRVEFDTRATPPGFSSCIP